jgi:hypothetical protein
MAGAIPRRQKSEFLAPASYCPAGAGDEDDAVAEHHNEVASLRSGLGLTPVSSFSRTLKGLISPAPRTREKIAIAR